MIRCTPHGLCSWDFNIVTSDHAAYAEFEWGGEQGSLTIDDELYQVRKHGLFSGRWTLDDDRTTIATGQKTSVLARTIDLQTPAGPVTLQAKSPFGRTMLFRGSGYNGVITPDHPLTRRASITGTIPDFRVACFAFWLTVLLWRRAADSDSS